MKNKKFMAILIVLTLTLALVFASCDKSGDETTAPSVTETPVTDVPTDPAEETTAAPDTTKTDDTASVPVETTSTPVETTNTPVETTNTPEETTTLPEETTETPHVHSFGVWNTVKLASCTEEGLMERTCTCGEKETEVLAKTAHRDGEWIEDKAASCTEAGSKHLECSVCGTSLKTASIAALGHKDGEWIIDKEATADAEGSKHMECSVCKETLKTEVLPATPHTPGEWIVDKESTCTETGSRHRVCTKCGETTDVEVISVKDHVEAIDRALSATCTESGLTEGKHCTVCNTVIKAQEVIPAMGHLEVVDDAKEPTCTENGLTMGKHCSICNAVIKAQEIVPAKGHIEVTDPAKEATCTESGFTEGKYCSVCDAVIKAPEIIPSKGGHTEGEWIVDKEATASSTGSKHLECTVCGKTIKTEQIPVVELPKIAYTATVVDGFGAPMSGIEVSFMNGNEEVSKVKTNADGKAVANLTSGVYTVVVHASDEYFASAKSFEVNESNTELEVKLVTFAQNPEMVYPGASETDTVLAGVYTVSTGSVRIPVEKGKIRYLFFSPSEGALYHVYTDSDKVEVGYYGGSFFVSQTNIGNIDENGVLILEVLHTQIGGKLVFGITSTSASVDECTFTIVKAAEVEIKDEERPWEQFVPTQVPTKQVSTPSGDMKYVPIEINFSTMQGTKEIQVVYNEKDGYYHLHTADGPVLYVRITQPTKYLEASFRGIVEFSNIGKTFYDEEGKLIKKESYCDAMYINTSLYPDNKNPYYAQVADKKYGVVPLNEELIYILKNLGEGDWYKKGSPDYIFDNTTIPADVMPQNAWLFACVYFE